MPAPTKLPRRKNPTAKKGLSAPSPVTHIFKLLFSSLTFHRSLQNMRSSSYAVDKPHNSQVTCHILKSPTHMSAKYALPLQQGQHCSFISAPLLGKRNFTLFLSLLSQLNYQLPLKKITYILLNYFKYIPITIEGLRLLITPQLPTTSGLMGLTRLPLTLTSYGNEYRYITNTLTRALNIHIIFLLNAGIAQLVEQLTCNQWVPSSTLGAGTIQTLQSWMLKKFWRYCSFVYLFFVSVITHDWN